MSANHSLILFEGDISSQFDIVFNCFKLKTTGTVEPIKGGLSEVWEYTNWPRRNRARNCVHKAALFNGTWTGVLDREMNMVIDQESCKHCAAALGIKIFGYMIECVSGTCVMYHFSPEKVRGLNIQNFELLEDFGNPLPQESGITLENMLEDGPMRISRRLGFADSLFAHPTSKILVVEMEDPVRTQTLQHHQEDKNGKAPRRPKEKETVPATRKEKPWWKLW